MGKIEPINDPTIQQFYGSSTTEAYRLKSELVGKCMEEIGMGRFQWELFIVTGFGWIVDNFASQGIGSVQPPIQLEFSDISRVSYSSVAYYVGLILGASFWGISSDLVGRKPAFNITLLIAGVFLCGAAGSMNFVGFSALWAVIGTAAGGNVPVDSMIFLEFVPGSHQWLLTALSAWWNLGQLIVSLLAWVFLANYSCPTDATPETCVRRENMGWRYTLITLGALSLAFTFIRIFVFRLPETPRYLLSQGKDQAAVDAVNYVARQNGKEEPLTIGMLRDIDYRLGTASPEREATGLSTTEIIRENFKDFRGSHYQALFATRQLSRHTILVWVDHWYRISPILQLPAVVSGDEVYTRLVIVSDISQLLHSVGRGYRWPTVGGLSRKHFSWPTLDDGDLVHCDRSIPVCVCRGRNAQGEFGLLVHNRAAGQFWYVLA
ncbi:conserved hypothetical protein [Aspergillus terreus NIH2624]|uniref:Major facilitator superfamily (MFS) profile domain-containing protein n=1 Tax=Aspergillus terreus (strain NIH 2624 / FGSC A1156) TaxID=341663 RepID=Q0CCG4_ASPTN|nr:uncharacterized protein ATEG_08620 [Aspergillus terreus NIH2624]EAU30752.1 conserved hypothetical protein [Aspergillus terreus NIH2624]